MTTLRILTPKTLLLTTASVGLTYYLTPPLVPHQLYLHHVLAPHAILIAALLFPIPAAAALPPLAASYAYLFRSTSTTPWSTAITFATGLVTTYHLLLSLSLLVFTDPKSDFQHHNTPYPPRLRHRLPWILNLVHSPRLVGWNTQQPLPPLPAPSTPARLRSLALCYAYLDFLSWFQKIHAPDLFLPPTTRVTPLAALLGASAIYAGIQATYTALALFCIHVLRWGRNDDWPHVFGPLASLGDDGVAGFWTNGWHGILRFLFTAPGKWLARVTRYEHRAEGAREAVKVACNLVLPFAVSAALHYGAAVTRGCDGAAVAGFFLLQPLGVLLENRMATKAVPKAVEAGAEVVAGGKGKGRKGARKEKEEKGKAEEVLERKTTVLRRIVRWGWTFCWLAWSSRGFWEGFGGGGLWTLEPVPMSAWRAARGECPWRWGGVGGWWAPPGEGGVLGQWAWKL